MITRMMPLIEKGCTVFMDVVGSFVRAPGRFPGVLPGIRDLLNFIQGHGAAHALPCPFEEAGTPSCGIGLGGVIC